MGEFPLLLSYALLFLSALVLYLPVIPEPIKISDTDLGYLRGGTRGAVITALTALRADGLIEVRKRGGVRRTHRALGSGADTLERAVYVALHTAAGPRSIAAMPAVRRALDATAKRLAGAGLIAGPARMMLGRAMLIAVPIVAIVRLAAGDAATSTFVGLGTAVVIAACLWLPSRRTIAGHGVLRTLRREHGRLIAEWTPSEHNPHDPALDGQLHHGAGVAAARSLFTTAIALGLVIDLVATTGIMVPNSGGDGADFDGGDFGWDSGGFDGGDFGWDSGGGWDGGGGHDGGGGFGGDGGGGGGGDGGGY